VPLRRGTPYELPVDDSHGESYTLNAGLVAWAYSLTKDVPLGDSEKIQKSRARFAGFANAVKPPFVTRGDDLSSSTFWHGSKMEDWANAWTSYYTGGKGNYMVTAMEDTGTMQSLTFLAAARRVDLHRVLVLRTISNFDREPPGGDAAESLQSMVAGNYSAYMESLNAAYVVGDRVVRDIVEHWDERESTIPAAP
jgi:purine nucleoside permease